jgi:AGCS family alanine or glycine:cation symporter
LGVGNIIGVSTAVLAGGPGSIFWMWIIGLLSMATSYAENLLAFKYRARDRAGNIFGGAMYVWRRHFTKRSSLVKLIAFCLAGLFAIFATIKTLLTVSAVQANSVSSVVTASSPSVPAWVVGLVMVFLVGLVIIGGLKKIAKVCEFFVPLMVVLYVGVCIYVLTTHADLILSSIELIMTDAFSPQSALGGAIGGGIISALRFGAARGLFTSEAGLGSTPIALATAKSKNAAQTGLVAMTGVFWDTIVMCALTGVMIVVTILANPELQSSLVNGQIDSGGALMASVFSNIPLVGGWLLTVSVAVFAFLTIVGWSYYGNQCLRYLFGRGSSNFFNLAYLSVIFIGTISASQLVWHLSDTFNMFMMIPNILLVVLLSGLVAKETRKYTGKNINKIDDSSIPMIDK